MKITLALGGGGAKGNAHIGVIRRLEREGIRIAALAGTSFGGVVAIFYALGYSPDEIENLFAGLDQTQLYGFSAEEGPSLLGLAGVTKWLKATIGDRTFADVRIPCVVTATDLKSGCEIVLSHGSLVEAILATVAIPGIFPARRLGEWELVDGGTLDPVPVAPARALQPRLPVIAVALTAPTGSSAQTWNLPWPNYLPRPIVERISNLRYARALDIFSRSLDLVVRAVTEYRLAVDKPAVILRPAVTEMDILQRVDVHEVVMKGEESVEAALPEIRRLFLWQTRLWNALGFQALTDRRFASIAGPIQQDHGGQPHTHLSRNGR
jgi:NTE family protein